MSDANKQAGNSALGRALQLMIWFLLVASTLAGATSLAMELVI
jgi:hypothetical protein